MLKTFLGAKWPQEICKFVRPPKRLAQKTDEQVMVCIAYHLEDWREE